MKKFLKIFILFLLTFAMIQFFVPFRASAEDCSFDSDDGCINVINCSAPSGKQCSYQKTGTGSTAPSGKVLYNCQCYHPPKPTPTPVKPAESDTKSNSTKIKFVPQVPIPGKVEKAGDYNFGSREGIDLTNETTIRPIGEYIRWIYKYLIGVVGILSTIIMMWGGVLWLASAGDSGKITEAKTWITSSITGLLLALSSYLILATINTNLVELNVRSIPQISDKKISVEATLDKFGTCKTPAGCGAMQSESDCVKISGGTWLGNDSDKIIKECGIEVINCSSSKELFPCKTTTGSLGYCVNGACTSNEAKAGEKCGGYNTSGTCKKTSYVLGSVRNAAYAMTLSKEAYGYCPVGSGPWIVGGRDCDGLNYICCK